MKLEIMQNAYKAGGYRERYAMDHHTTMQVKKENGHKLLVFYYSPADPYQDANGATYDVRKGAWVR